MNGRMGLRFGVKTSSLSHSQVLAITIITIMTMWPAARARPCKMPGWITVLGNYTRWAGGIELSMPSPDLLIGPVGSSHAPTASSVRHWETGRVVEQAM